MAKATVSCLFFLLKMSTLFFFPLEDSLLTSSRQTEFIAFFIQLHSLTDMQQIKIKPGTTNCHELKIAKDRA